MVVKKNRNRGRTTKASELLCVNVSRPNMTIFSAVRDLILPYAYVFLETKENGDFIIIPTNSEDGYKLSTYNGSTRISACGLLRELNVKQKTRIRCKRQADGSILCLASEVI